MILETVRKLREDDIPPGPDDGTYLAESRDPSDHAEVLHKHGWDLADTGAGVDGYAHEKYPHHVVAVFTSGKERGRWEHVDWEGDGSIARGGHSEGLEKHLDKFHGKNEELEEARSYDKIRNDLVAAVENARNSSSKKKHQANLQRYDDENKKHRQDVRNRRRRGVSEDFVDEGRGRPRKDGTSASTEDAGDSNIIYQLKKAVTLRGHQIRFQNGESASVHPNMAHKAIQMHLAHQKPSDKEAFQAKLGASHASFRSAVGGG